MSNTEYLKSWQPGESGNPAGKPVGAKNRSTIARKVLEMRGILPTATFEKLKEVYPELTQNMTAEEMATLVQLVNAITKGDTNAYKAIFDSAYGMPKQGVEVEGLQAMAAPVINIYNSAPPMAQSEKEVDLPDDPDV